MTLTDLLPLFRNRQKGTEDRGEGFGSEKFRNRFVDNSLRISKIYEIVAV